MHFYLAGYDIDVNKVIGIGPLRIESSADTALRMVYNPQRFFFQLFFESYSAELSSATLNTIGVNDDVKKANRQKLLDFENGYVDLRAFVIDKISK